MKCGQLNEFGTACESLVWCHSCGIQYHSCGIGPTSVESSTTPVELVPLLWNQSHSCGPLSHSCGLHRSPVSPTGMGGALKSTALGVVFVSPVL